MYENVRDISYLSRGADLFRLFSAGHETSPSVCVYASSLLSNKYDRKKLFVQRERNYARRSPPKMETRCCLFVFSPNFDPLRPVYFFSNEKMRL